MKGAIMVSRNVITRWAFVLCCLTGAHTVKAEDTPPAFGAMLLGTGLISGIMELRREDTSFRVTAGIFDIETCVSATVIRYGRVGRLQPYAGIGMWSVSFIPGLVTGRLLAASMPIGVRWRFGEGRYLGIEADLHYLVGGLNPDGSRITINDDMNFIPLPGIYCIWAR